MAATLQLEVYEVSGSVNVQNNTSRLYVHLQITTTAGTYNHSGDTTGSIAVEGQSYSLNGKKVDYNTVTTLYEDTRTVTHTTDGSKSLTVAAEFDPNTPGTSRMTISKTVKLTDIPRASTVTATDGNIGSVSMVAVNRRSTKYTHSIAYAFGNLTGWLKEDGTLSETEVRFSNTAVGFSLPQSFYAQIPNKPSGVCTLTCKTYQGNTQIGDTQRTTFTVTADENLCRPGAVFSVEDVNAATLALTGNKNTLVRYGSTARCTLTATAKNSASIAAKSINGKAVSGAYLDIPLVESDTASYGITDSRGYSQAGQVVSAMVDYIPLTANVSAKRTDPTSGNAVVSVSGNYYDGSFGSKSNFLQIVCKVGNQEAVLTPTVTDGTYRAQGSFSELDYRSSHSVTVTVTDALKTLERTLTIGKGIPVFDWGEEDFRFHVPVTLPNPTADDQAVNLQYLKEKALLKTGGTVNGTVFMGNGSGVQTDAAWASMAFKNPQGQTRASIMTTQANAIHFNNHPTAGHPYAERYYFPAPDGDLQADIWHSILTSKSPVTVVQGGTGAKTAAAARSNLGLGCTKLLSGAGSAGGHGSYKMYLVMGKPAQNASIMTLLIPASEVTATAVKYQIADSTDYVSFNLSASGANLTISKAAGNGTITAVYGIN